MLAQCTINILCGNYNANYNAQAQCMMHDWNFTSDQNKIRAKYVNNRQQDTKHHLTYRHDVSQNCHSTTIMICFIFVLYNNNNNNNRVTWQSLTKTSQFRREFKELSRTMSIQKRFATLWRHKWLWYGDFEMTSWVTNLYDMSGDAMTCCPLKININLISQMVNLCEKFTMWEYSNIVWLFCE